MSAFDPKRTLTTLSRDPRPNVRPTNSSLLIRSATTPDLREGQYLICRNVLLLDLVKEIACVSHQTCEPNQIAINTAKRPSWMLSRTCSALTNEFRVSPHAASRRLVDRRASRYFRNALGPARPSPPVTQRRFRCCGAELLLSLIHI